MLEISGVVDQLLASQEGLSSLVYVNYDLSEWLNGDIVYTLVTNSLYPLLTGNFCLKVKMHKTREYYFSKYSFIQYVQVSKVVAA
jgi:hypothetical protein